MRTLLAVLLFALPAVAAPVPKGVKKPQPTSPDGAWHLVEFVGDGKPGDLKGFTRDWFFEGEHLFIGAKQRPAPDAPRPAPNFTVRDQARPNLRMWGRNPAVYEVDGDTLRACYAHDGRKELTECKPGMGIHYYVFERAKEGR